jgi:hypothetical protein
LNKALTDLELDHLLEFIGFGRLDADIWFLGLEEGSGDENYLRQRLDFEIVQDTKDTQNTLGISEDQFCEKYLQGAWKGMCEIMLKLEGKETSEENILTYRSERLGRSEGSTLLCELLPLPMPVEPVWSYAEVLPQYNSRETYLAAVKPLRFEQYRELIHEYAPKIILAYGQAAWPDYMELFHNFKLTQHGQFLLGWDANTVVILCDHFSTETMEGKVTELVDLILDNSLSIELTKPVGQAPLSKAELARQKKEAAKQAATAKRKSTAKHNPSDPYCVCAYCLGYESE